MSKWQQNLRKNFTTHFKYRHSKLNIKIFTLYSPCILSGAASMSLCIDKKITQIHQNTEIYIYKQWYLDIYEYM